MRIDKYLAEKLGSRTKAANMVSKGIVLVNGKSVDPSYEVKASDEIEIVEQRENYVSAGGFKLAKALNDFNASVSDMVFADIGASTGGFTHCLLKNGAKKVYCIDVGESQLDKSLLSDKVIVLDNFNARNLTLELFSEKLDGVVVDVSFISLTYILGVVSQILESDRVVYALIKPQFECETHRVGKNGIVRERKIHEKVIKKIYEFALSVGLAPQNICDAPIIKGKNIEYMIYLKKGAQPENIEKLLKTVTL